MGLLHHFSNGVNCRVFDNILTKSAIYKLLRLITLEIAIYNCVHVKTRVYEIYIYIYVRQYIEEIGPELYLFS